MSTQSSRIRNQTPDQRQRREVGQESTTEQAARLQPWREGSLLEWRGMLAAAEREGNLDSNPEPEENYDSGDEDLADLLDSEISLHDEDEFLKDDLAEKDVFEGEGMSLDWMGEAGDDLAELDSKFNLQVVGGRCRLHIPGWFRFRAKNEKGEEILTEAHNRLDTLNRIANWLSDKRVLFLQSGDPWDLGASAMEELGRGTTSVTEEGLRALAGIASQQFSRHRRHAAILWDNGFLPLDFLLGPEAKQAWVANALVQQYERLGEPITEASLKRVAELTMPKTSAEKHRILGGSLAALGFSDFARRACLTAGVAWPEVMNVLRRNYLKKPHQS